MSQESIKEMLKMIDAKIEHIEDITADNRAVIIKLVKQSNQICKFLKSLEIDITEEYEKQNVTSYDNIFEDSNISAEKLLEVKELLEEFKIKNKDLKELEEELQKNKNDITPGQIGEA